MVTSISAKSGLPPLLGGGAVEPLDLPSEKGQHARNGLDGSRHGLGAPQSPLHRFTPLIGWLWLYIYNKTPPS
jgi:hypothetical protein